MTDIFELGPIRPPSEAFSLLLRLTRNCPWNRCRFCGIYKSTKFQLRPVEEIKQDIDSARRLYDRIVEYSRNNGYDGRLREAARAVLGGQTDQALRTVALWLYGGGESVFLQDANTLIMRTHELVEVLNYIKETFPSVTRITSYGRSNTAAKKSLDELLEIHRAGLSRLHVGLESGSDAVLKLMDKGVTAEEHIIAGRKVVESGISLSEYVLLGLGGRGLWREHATETARVLNEINPDFIRIRTLNISPDLPMNADIADGSWIMPTDDEVMEELRLLIEHLDCSASLVSDHIYNLLQEVEGKLPQDKARMLAIIDRYLSLPLEERTNFRIGRRAQIYVRLDDLNNNRKHQAVERIIHELTHGNYPDNQPAIDRFMEGYFVTI